MKIGSQNSNVNFGKVFAIAGSKEQFARLHEIVSSSKGQYGLYSLQAKKLPGTDGDTFLKNAKSMKKNVYVLVAGQEDIDNIIMEKKGWTSLQSICNKVTSFINLRNVDDDVSQILSEMKKH